MTRMTMLGHGVCTVEWGGGASTPETEQLMSDDGVTKG